MGLGSLRDDAIPATTLGLVECNIRPLHQLCDPVRTTPQRRHANTDGYRDRRTATANRKRCFLDLGADALGDLLGDVRLRVGHDHDELLTAVAAGEVDAPHVLA